jgi:hypothetical protein
MWLYEDARPEFCDTCKTAIIDKYGCNCEEFLNDIRDAICSDWLNLDDASVGIEFIGALSKLVIDRLEHDFDLKVESFTPESATMIIDSHAVELFQRKFEVGKGEHEFEWDVRLIHWDLPVRNIELIRYYERQLEKVKSAYRVEGLKEGSLDYDKNIGFIRSAEDDLEAVKNGREW